MKERPPGPTLALLLLCATACASDGISLGTLTSLTWLPGSSSDGEATLKVCPTSPLPSLESAVFTYTSKNKGTQGGQLVDEIINLPNIGCNDGCCSFTIDTNTIDFENEKRYQLEVPDMFYLNDILLKMKPQDILVAQNEGLGLYRYQHNGDLVVDGGAVDGCITNLVDALPNVCYSTTDEICIKGGKDESVLICNEPVSITPKDAVDKLKSHLDDADKSVLFEQDEDSRLLEVLVISGTSDPPDYTYCGDDALCDAPSLPSDFSVVKTDSQGNTESWSKVTVSDWEVVVSAVSKDTLRASWTGTSSAPFEVTLTPPDDTSALRYSTVTGPSCDEASSCEAFFAWLPDVEGDYTDYTVEVFNGVDAVIEGVTVTPVDKLTEETKYSLEMTHDLSKTKIVNTNACFKEASSKPISEADLPGSSKFVVIDSTGNSVSQGLATDSSNCFETLDIAKDVFAITEEARLLLYSEETNEVTSWQLDRTLFLPSFQPRSAGSVVLASWTNANDGTVKSKGFKDDKDSYDVECPPLLECEYYLETGKTMEEATPSLVQRVTPDTSVPGAETLTLITPFEQRPDNRFLVCFEPVEGAEGLTYELGMEKPGSLSSYSAQTQQTTDANDNTCLLTAEPVAVGSYSEVWAVVTGFDEDGTVARGGDDTYAYLLAADDAHVLGVVQYADDSTDVWVSWTLVDDGAGLGSYEVELRNEQGDVLGPEKVDQPSTSVTFENVDSGSYSACVTIKVEEQESLELRLCSAIIYVDAPSETQPDPPASVDKINHQLDTEQNSITISWEYEKTENWEEVASFLVTWTGSGGDAENMGAARSRSARAASKDGFTMVPGSKGGVKLNLPKDSYTICVSSNGGSSSSDPSCVEDEVTVDYDDNPPEEPTNLNYKSKTLSWDQPQNGCDDPQNPCSYSVQWTRGATLRTTQTMQTSLDLNSQPIGPGTWTMEVKTLRNSVASRADRIRVEIDGLDVKYKQSGSEEVTLEWTGTEGVTYTVKVAGEEQDPVTCSGTCYVAVSPVKDGDTIIVTADADDASGPGWTYKVSMDEIPDVNLLEKSLDGKTNTTVTWDCVDGASEYNISLVYNDNSTVYYTQSYPCSVSIDETSSHAEVQACFTATGTTCTQRCGDPLVTSADGGGDKSSSNTLTIVLSVVAGVALLAVLALVGFIYLRPSSKKSTKLDDGLESRFGDTAVSIHTDENDPKNYGFSNAGFGAEPEQLDPKRLSRPESRQPGPQRPTRGNYGPDDGYRAPRKLMDPREHTRAPRSDIDRDNYGPPRRKVDPEDPYRAPRQEPDYPESRKVLPREQYRAPRPYPRSSEREMDRHRSPRRRHQSSRREMERGRSPRRRPRSWHQDMEDSVSPRRRQRSSNREMGEARPSGRSYPPRDDRDAPRQSRRQNLNDHVMDIPMKEYPHSPPRRSQYQRGGAENRYSDEFSKPYNRRSSPKPTAAPTNGNFLMRAKSTGYDGAY